MDKLLLAVSDHQIQAGARLRILLEAAGIKQVDAAAAMGITKNHLGNWLRGESPFKAYELYRLHRLTGITADWVLLGDPSGLPQRLAKALELAELSPQPAVLPA